MTSNTRTQNGLAAVYAVAPFAAYAIGRLSPWAAQAQKSWSGEAMLAVALAYIALGAWVSLRFTFAQVRADRAEIEEMIR